MDDDFVKGLNIDDVSNVKEYRAYVKSQLQANKESEAEKKTRGKTAGTDKAAATSATPAAADSTAGKDGE